MNIPAISPRRYLVALVLGLSWLALPGSGQTAPPPPPSDKEIDGLIKEYEQRLSQGEFPTEDMQKLWWKAPDPFMSLLNKYSGLGGSTVTVMLGGATEGERVLPKLSSAFEELGYWTAVYDVASKLAEGSPNSRTLAFLSAAKTYLGNVLSKRGPGGSLMGAGVGFIDYSLTSLGERAVFLSNQKWWNAYVAFQEREHPDAKLWVELMLRDNGSLDGVAAQLDRFWLETEEVRGEDFFRTNNPKCVEDYRSRYLRKEIMPAIKIWAEGQQIIARNGVKFALAAEALKLRTAQVRITGEVRNYLEKYSSEPVKYRMVLDAPKETKEGTGSYDFAVPLRDLNNGSFSISIQPYGQWQRWEVAGEGSRTVRIGNPRDSTPGVTTKTWKDGTIIITMPVFKIGAIGGQPSHPTLPPGRVDEPAQPDDGLIKIEPKAQTVLSGYAGRKISYYEASGDLRLFGQELDAEMQRQSGGAEATAQAIKQNADLDCAPLYAQNKSAEASRIQAEANARIKLVRDTESARRSKNNALGQAWRDWMRQEEEVLRKRDQAIEARLKAIEDESRLADKEYEESEREVNKVFSVVDEMAYMTSMGAAEDGDPFGESVVSEVFHGIEGGAPNDPQAAEQKLLEVMTAMGEKFDGVYQKLLAQEERIRALQEKYLACNADLAVLQKQKVGLEAKDYPFGAGSSSSRLSDGLLHNWGRRLDNLTTLRAIKTDQRVKTDLTTTTTVLKRRIPQYATNNADLMRLEELMKSSVFPTAEQARMASADYENLAGETIGYLTLLGQGVVNNNPAMVLPATMRDEKGSDAAFLQRQLGAYRDFIEQNKALCSDLLSGADRAPTDLSAARSLVASISAREKFLSYSQRQHFSELGNQFSTIWQNRRMEWLDRLYRALHVMQPLGAKPGERITALIEKNRTQAGLFAQQAQVVAALPKVTFATAASQKDDAMRQISALLAAVDEAGGLPSECRTLDLLVAQSSLLQASAANGAPAILRAQNNQPQPPGSVSINEKMVPLDGRILRMKYAELPLVVAGGDEHRLKVVRPRSNVYQVEQRLVPLGPSFSTGWAENNGTLTLGWKQAPKAPEVLLLTENCIGAGGTTSWIPGDPARLLLVVEP